MIPLSSSSSRGKTRLLSFFFRRYLKCPRSDRPNGYSVGSMETNHGRLGRLPGPNARQLAGRGPAPSARDRATRHVVHVIGCLDRGGAETTSLDICRAVAPRDFAQTFLALGEAEGSLAGQFRAAGAEVSTCPLYPRRSFPLRLWRRLRALRADVVVSHVALASAVVLLVAKAAGVPVRVARMWSEGDGKPDRV